MTSSTDNQKTVDLTTRAGARFLLMHDDSALRERISSALGPEIDCVADAVALCFERFLPIHHASRERSSERGELIHRLAHGALDDLIVSVMLLLGGKAAASGNVARQSIEGLAMAVLCSTDEDIVIKQPSKSDDGRGRYWVRIQNPDDRQVEGQHAVRQLRWNAELLRIPEGWVDKIEKAQKFFSAASHAGPTGLAHRIDPDSPYTMSFGGHFDPSKLESYRRHMTIRALMARDVSDVMYYLRQAVMRAS